ncbi:HNH endonuclease [Streptomyces sp. CAU 1734]|uniref:HNH endonuclease n=1 Tax=Streptomyces sp. CAU 1734 TaxID=3140360 RepID=UPI0032612A8E
MLDGHPNIHHVTASGLLAQIQLSKGINPIARVKAFDGPRRPSILIRSSPWKAGSAETPWHDVFDLDNGRVTYFGDHRVDHTVPVGETQGNAVLLESMGEHRARTEEQRAGAVPLLVFAAVSRNRTPKGYVQFCGVAVIRDAEQIEQKAEGESFPNYRYELSVLDLSAEDNRIDWAWIEARGNPELSTAETLDAAPLSWRRWVELGQTALPERRRPPTPPTPGEPGALFPAPRRPDDTGAGSPARVAPSRKLTAPRFMERLRNLRAQSGHGRRDEHLPLALLWGIGRVVAGESPRAPWPRFRDEMDELWTEFVPSGSSVSLEYPVRHHHGSRLPDAHVIPPEQDFLLPAAAHDRFLHAEGGVTEEVERLLKDPYVRSQTVAVLRENHLSGVDQPSLMERLGLTGYESASGADDDEDQGSGAGPVARRVAHLSRTIRDTALVARVKRMHENSCQVCGLRLPTRTGTYSEAAHVRGLGRPHNGPDEAANLLVLCPNHHVQFDTLAIYIDMADTVRSTVDDSPVSELRTHPDHLISTAHLRYHRALCGRDTAHFPSSGDGSP